MEELGSNTRHVTEELRRVVKVDEVIEMIEKVEEFGPGTSLFRPRCSPPIRKRTWTTFRLTIKLWGTTTSPVANMVTTSFAATSPVSPSCTARKWPVLEKRRRTTPFTKAFHDQFP
eukprot:GHVN01052348.1.p3 GENE.GHVN01052348.1~~GHVN01052348.1.p3  ORF type:complete len:116 (+),score=8.07 GHVN01052348.1:237-584(+)